MRSFSKLTQAEKNNLAMAIANGSAKTTKFPMQGVMKLAYIWPGEDLEYLVVRDNPTYDEDFDLDDDDDDDDDDDFGGDDADEFGNFPD